MLFYSLFYFFIAIAILYASQFFFDHDEFIMFIKLFFIGILAAVVYRFIFGFIDNAFNGISHPTMIFIYFLIHKGILSIFSITAIYFILHSFTSFINVQTDIRNTAFLISAMLCGFYVVYTFYEVKQQNIPHILEYIHYLSSFLIITTCSGYGLSKFIEGYSMQEKIIGVLTAIFLPSLITASLMLAVFYNPLWSFLSVIVAAVSFFVFIKISQ